MKTYLKNIFSTKSNYNSYGKEILFYFVTLGLLFLFGVFVHGIIHILNNAILVRVVAGIFSIVFITVSAFLFIRLLSITDSKKTNE